MDIITILIASISFVVVIATTVIYAQKSVDIQKDYDSKLRLMRKQVNDVQDESFKYDQKQQSVIDATKVSVEDIRKDYVKRGDISSKITTEMLNAASISGNTITGNSINADVMTAGSSKFTNIGASLDRAWNNNPSLTFSEETDFAIHSSGIGKSANLWVDGGINSAKTISGESASFKGLNINGQKDDWVAQLKNKGVTMEMAHGRGKGLDVNTVGNEADGYGLNISSAGASKFKVFNDGRQEMNTDLTPDQWAWTWKSSGKGALGGASSSVKIGRENDGIDISMNNDSSSRSALKIKNITAEGPSELLNIRNNGMVEIPGTLVSGKNQMSELTVRNNTNTTMFGSTNTISGQTTFDEATKFQKGIEIMNADGTVSKLGGAANSLTGTTTATDFITNDIKFSKNFAEYPDTANSKAEIANDQDKYKTLMIVGNKARNGSQRTVGVWDRLDVNGPLYPDSVSMNGSGGLAVGTLDKANAGEVRIRTRDLEDIYTIFNDVQNRNFIRGASTTIDNPVDVKQLTLKNPLMIDSESPGPLIERNMGTNANRSGVGAFQGGATRVYAADVTSVPSASINFSFAKADGTFDDVVTVNAYKQTTVNGPMNILGKMSTNNQICINDTCLTESDLQKLKSIP